MIGKKFLFHIILVVLMISSLNALSKSSPRILIMGDSHAYALSEAIKNNSPGDWDITLKGISSSGLVREDFFNWIEWSKHLETEYDYVFIILGTNDGQNIDSFSALPFGTKEWELFYSARVEQLLFTLNHNKKIFWVSIPPVKPEDLARKTEYIQSIITEVCQFHNIKVLNSYTNPFSENLTFFKEDGIHLSAKGSEILFLSLLGEVNKIADKRLP